MYLTQISYNNFRCLEDRKIEFDKNMNIIYGKNGQGKTSLIESIYFLGTGKSFRTKKTKERQEELQLHNKSIFISPKITVILLITIHQ